MPRKTIQAVNNVHFKLENVIFQFEYIDGSKERFACDGGIMQNMILSVLAQSDFTVPKGDLPMSYQILRADTTGAIIIRILYPGNKTATLAVDTDTAKKMGEQLIAAANSSPDPGQNP